MAGIKRVSLVASSNELFITDIRQCRVDRRRPYCSAWNWRFASNFVHQIGKGHDPSLWPWAERSRDRQGGLNQSAIHHQGVGESSPVSWCKIFYLGTIQQNEPHFDYYNVKSDEMKGYYRPKDKPNFVKKERWSTVTLWKNGECMKVPFELEKSLACVTHNKSQHFEKAESGLHS